ncbi:MAG: polymer-forming cytoskeletal protein [Flavobacteriales bacterium]|nr:polymer-forming cytoskeletal protein [Flavobacteriales bacterium]
MLFKRKNKENDQNDGLHQNAITALLNMPHGTVVIGDIQTNGNVRVECDVKGKIMAGGRVVLSDTARMEGHIKCASALIMGQINGNILATGEVRLNVPAKVRGNIMAGDIHMEKGVVIDGKYKIVNDNGADIAPTIISPKNEQE